MEKISLQDQQLLEKILSDPFFYTYKPEVRESPSGDEHYDTATGVQFREEKAILKLFSDELTEVCKPYINISHEILFRINQARTRRISKIVIDQYGQDLLEKLENIRKFYRLFIETSSREFLQEEARKLVKRFFGEDFTPNQLQFLVMKRYVEKLKSFYEIAIPNWKDVEKLLHILAGMDETKEYFEDILTSLLGKISILNHQMETYLRLLQNYLKIQEFQYNASNYSYIAVLSYDENIDYSLKGLTRSLEITLSEDTQIPETIEILKKEEKTRTLLLDVEIKKFQKSTLATRVLGSKDWNRTTDYYLEVKKSDYEKDLEKFHNSFFIIYNETSIEEATNIYTSKRPKLDKNQIQEILLEYINMLQMLFEETYEAIIESDFHGIIQPHIFFYHTGAYTVFNMIFELLREKKMGEIYFMENNLITHMYPVALIKKIFIEWWNELTQYLDPEDIDSYSLYAFQQEMVFDIYYRDYLKIKQEFEKSHSSYFTFERWFYENFRQFINIRKFYIYRRFFPRLLIDFHKLPLPSSLTSPVP